jgi:putative transposase
LVRRLHAQGVGERMACRAVGIGRASYRYEARPPTRTDESVRQRMRDLARAHRRYGYRRITALLRREGLRINPKRTWRLWKEEGLKLPRKRPKRPKRRAEGTTDPRPRPAERANEVWSLDFVHDRTVTGRPLRMLPVLDEYTRECLRIRVRQRQTSEDVRETLGDLIKRHGKPGGVRFDNGPEFRSDALREWLERQGIRPLYIEPGSPRENGYQESFNGKFRDECLNMELFWNDTEAQVIVEDWRKHYNTDRPHSALGYQTPAETARSPEDAATAMNSDIQGANNGAPINP